MKTHLLVTPLARGAYFDDLFDVARAELHVHFPDAPVEIVQIGGLDFFVTDLPPEALNAAARLSFVQGAFEADAEGRLRPLDLQTGFQLPEQLVTGIKYRGKTHELVTQMAINLALKHAQTGRAAPTLLDPLAGKGTTLLWALRYGINSRGVEHDLAAPDALHAHVKKLTRLHRLKHKHSKGSVGKKSKDGAGKFIQYEFGGHNLQLITGDSRHAASLLGGQRFDLIVSDLPYGIQFKGGSKGLFGLIEGCAEGWFKSLRDGGAMVLIFNTYRPTRAQLIGLFEGLGAEIDGFSAPHRMSESIVRDLLVIKKAPRA